MDRLKFRVWVGKNEFYEDRAKKYVDGVLLEQDGSYSFTNSEDDFAEDVKMEFSTGLRDNLGVLLYEGDIVQTFYKGLCKEKYYFEYGKTDLYAILIDSESKNNGRKYCRSVILEENCFKIGNVNENPELLEQ